MRLRYGLCLAFTVACGSATSSSNNPSPPPPPGPTPPPPPPSGSVAVKITNYSFSPDTTSISVGQSVRWTNNDGVSHSVTSDTGTTLNSGAIAGTGTDSYGNPTGGGNYTKAFFTKGTLLYHCSIHPTTMQGVVIVN